MNNLIKSVFLSENVNKPEGYIPFYYLNALLKSKFGSPKTFDYDGAAELLGYKNMTKLRRRVMEWIDISTPEIPLKFLDFISVTIEEIDGAIFLDQNEWYCTGSAENGVFLVLS